MNTKFYSSIITKTILYQTISLETPDLETLSSDYVDAYIKEN